MKPVKLHTLKSRSIFYLCCVGGGLSDTAGVLQLAPKPPHLLHLWGSPQVQTMFRIQSHGLIISNSVADPG